MERDSRPGRRSSAQPLEYPGLGEECEPVWHAPVLDDPPVDHSGDVDHRDLDGAPAGGSKEGPGGRATTGGAHPDRVTRLDEVVDRVGHVGDGGMHLADGVSDLLERLRSAAAEAELVLDQVGGGELVDDRGVAGGE